MSVRGDIVKALVKSQRRADVVKGPWPAAKPKPKRRKASGPLTINPTRLTPVPGKPGYFTDKKGTQYRIVTSPISGKRVLVRQDGAKFKLTKRGKWQLIGGKGGRK